MAKEKEIKAIEEQETPMENESPQETNLSRLRGRYKEAYPDDNGYDDDEYLYGKVMEGMDERDEKIKNYAENEKKFSDLISADPATAAWIADLAKGSNPLVSLVRNYGDLIRESIDDPDKMKELEDASKDYYARVAKNKELEEEYQKNLAESFENIEKAGIDEEDFNKAMDKMQEMMSGFVTGKFTADQIKLVLGGINHDKDVAEADHIAEVRGKNAKYEETLKKKNTGDNLPKLRSARAKKSESTPNLGVLNRFRDVQDPLAGAKRTKNV